MVRQARTYMVSAMSGATLIAIAIAVFVLLVSAQVFKNWPLTGLGDDGSASVSAARAAHSPPPPPAPSASAATVATTGAGAVSG
ncbi:MAG: hypothetical protein H0X42_01040, partial [Solirubrobacterales bacterium]|nr:hypothetical protein [Solirubrobacterales bacterium]